MPLYITAAGIGGNESLVYGDCTLKAEVFYNPSQSRSNIGAYIYMVQTYTIKSLI